MQQNSLVSIIIPAYNVCRHEKQFWLAIDSLIAQTYQNLEIIIVDDKSTDNTWDLLEEAAGKDCRIKIFKNTHNKAVAGALNECLDHATGDFIMRMDCDDSLAPDKVAKQVDFLQNNSEVVVVGTDLNIVNADNKVVGEKIHAASHAELVKGMYRLAALAHPTIMARAEAYKAFKYDEDLVTAEDVPLYFHFEKYGELASIPEKLYNYWINDKSNSFANIKRTLYYTLIARWRVAQTYAHKPSLLDIVFNLAQACLYLLPNWVIKSLYTQLRLRKSPLTLIKYVIIGILTVAIDVATYALLVAAGMNYLLADVANMPVFLTFNYLAHKYFTFKSDNKKAPEIGRYMLTVGINQIEALAILWVVVSVFGLNPYLGKLAQILILPITNFFLLKLFVYRK